MDWLAVAAEVLGSKGGQNGGGNVSWVSQTDSEKAESYSGFSNVTSGFSGLSGGEIAQITASQMPFWQWGGTAGSEPGSVMGQAPAVAGAASWGTVAVIGAGLLLVVFLLKKAR